MPVGEVLVTRARRSRFVRRVWFLWKWNFFRRMASHFLWRRVEREGIALLDLGNPLPSEVKGVVHSDIYGGDVRWDLRLKLPLNDQSVARIYSSHTLEHLAYSEIRGLLDECWRVLSPGGTIRLCLPDARIFISDYIAKRSSFESSAGFPDGWVDTGSSIDGLNYIAYLDGEHKILFDVELAVNLLTLSGFRGVTDSEYNPAWDSENRKIDSFYVTGVK